MSLFDECLAWFGNGIARCCIPNRKDERSSRGCCKRCGNPCRRIYKRCNECLGRPNPYPSDYHQPSNTGEAPANLVISERGDQGVNNSL